MTQSKRLLRIYVCATFRDFLGERRFLHEQFLPKIRWQWEQRDLRLELIDPGWNSEERHPTSAEAVEGDAGLIDSLNRIESCRPYFLCLLGQRYGKGFQRLTTSLVNVAPWIRTCRKGISRLHLEMHHGFLQQPQQATHAYVYLRDDNYFPPQDDVARQINLPDEPEEARQLMKFGPELEASQRPLRSYGCQWDGVRKESTGFDSFRDQLLADFTSIVRGAIPGHPLLKWDDPPLPVSRPEMVAPVEVQPIPVSGPDGLLVSRVKPMIPPRERIVAGDEVVDVPENSIHLQDILDAEGNPRTVPIIDLDAPERKDSVRAPTLADLPAPPRNSDSKRASDEGSSVYPVTMPDVNVPAVSEQEGSGTFADLPPMPIAPSSPSPPVLPRTLADLPPMPSPRPNPARTFAELPEIEAPRPAPRTPLGTFPELPEKIPGPTGTYVDFGSSRPGPTGTMADLNNGSPTPEPSEEKMHFTVARPRLVEPEWWYDLVAYIHLGNLRVDLLGDSSSAAAEALQRQADEYLGVVDSFASLKQEPKQRLPKLKEITLIPQVPNVEFDPPVIRYHWQNTLPRHEFRFRADSKLDGRTGTGCLSVYLGAILLGEVPINIRVQTDSELMVGSNIMDEERSVPFERCFPCLCPEDSEIIRQIETAARMLDNEFLREWKIFRTGQSFTPEVRRLIQEAEVFQLFWSFGSMVWKPCRQEWEIALAMNRPNFVRSVFWEQPLPTRRELQLPPEPLAKTFQYLGVQTDAPAPPSDYTPPPMFQKDLPKPEPKVEPKPKFEPKAEPKPEKPKPEVKPEPKAENPKPAVVPGVYLDADSFDLSDSDEQKGGIKPTLPKPAPTPPPAAPIPVSEKPPEDRSGMSNMISDEDANFRVPLREEDESSLGFGINPNDGSGLQMITEEELAIGNTNMGLAPVAVPLPDFRSKQVAKVEPPLPPKSTPPPKPAPPPESKKAIKPPPESKKTPKPPEPPAPPPPKPNPVKPKAKPRDRRESDATVNLPDPEDESPMAIPVQTTPIAPGIGRAPGRPGSSPSLNSISDRFPTPEIPPPPPNRRPRPVYNDNDYESQPIRLDESDYYDYSPKKPGQRRRKSGLPTWLLVLIGLVILGGIALVTVLLLRT